MKLKYESDCGICKTPCLARPGVMVGSCFCAGYPGYYGPTCGNCNGIDEENKIVDCAIAKEG